MIREELFKREAKVTPHNIGEAIQQAIEIEIATIPTYLYTYYTINRSPNQDVICQSLLDGMIKAGMPHKEANEKALWLSADIMVYANKAGAVIMSVVIEEMLHMALSSNMKQALAGKPLLTGNSPAEWPTYLPGHDPKFWINLAPFSLDQLVTFLKIESPTPLPTLLMATPIEYQTIGEFYKMIADCISDPANQPDPAHPLDPNRLHYDQKAPQLVPNRGYYAHNNIDTVYYDHKHNPHFVNADDDGDLVHVHDKDSALRAISIIVDQGEGYPNEDDKNWLLPGNKVDCHITDPNRTDDPSKKEFCHFVKFKELYCEYERLSKVFNELNIGNIDISKYFVINAPTNPKTSDYPANIRPVSDLLNGIYTYIFVMTEGCYSQDGNTQYKTFMYGIHKTMIFILNSICGDINTLKYTGADGKTYTAVATFENYPFNLLSSPKSQLVALYNAAVAVFPTISYLGSRITSLPDILL
jgi:hypothetical protein